MAAREIIIEPVTRVEGHAKITLQLGDDGRVADATFHVTQFRGFEKFCEGRPLTEMPSLMARICGICPVSHLIASAKACDELLAIDIPPAAANLRRVMNLAQLVQSHALSFFHLASPDLLLGMDADPAKRNLFGMLEERPQLARDGIRLRQIGQTIIEILGGKRIHPAWVVPGGVSAPLSVEDRDRMVAMLPEALEIGLRTLDWFKTLFQRFEVEIESLGHFPTMFLGLVDAQGKLEHYDGALRMISAAGEMVVDMLPCARYRELIAEAVEPFSYMKFPYYRKDGYPNGIYRVGPLARLNLVAACGTPRADEALAAFRRADGRPVLASFHYHAARLIEIVFAAERMRQLLEDATTLDPFVRARARPNRREGIGVAEAPRGTLIHHYKIDEDGLITWANLVIATGHNNLAMNRGVLQAAQRFVDGTRISEGALNRVEAVIRCFDPCLSCATHAVGQMPLLVQLVDSRGSVLDEVRRN
jgi:NAD-reducing hydrogenase large subunit